MNTRKFYIIHLPFISARLNILALLASIVIYIAFSIYLFRPHLNSLEPWRAAFIPASNIAATGTFLLATRWISNPAGAFFAGLLYAFGPYALGFALYHPASSILLAIIPWLFLPAAFWPHRASLRSHIVTSALMTLPFAAVVIFFYATSVYGFFPIPINQRLHFKPYISLLTPLMVSPSDYPIISFYHASLAPLIFGLFLYLRLHRVAPVIVFVLGTVLALLSPVGPISPIVWAAFPVLCLSILAGLGTNAVVLATEHDKTWLTLAGLILAAVAITSAFMARYFGQVLADASLWYFLSCLAIFIILILAHTRGQFHLARWIILSAVIGTDILYNARILVDRLF